MRGITCASTAFCSGSPTTRRLAEELVSDVFLAVWRDARSFAGKSEPSTWMLAIARHKAFSALKRRPHERLTDEVAAAMVDPADGAETMLDRDRRSAAIQACLTQLSPDHREVIDLVYYHDKSVEEVAEITGAPRSTVKTRMFYARKSLAKLIAASGCLDEAIAAHTLHEGAPVIPRPAASRNPESRLSCADAGFPGRPAAGMTV